MPKRIRVKFGRNPYAQEFACARCRRPFSGGGLFLRVESGGSVVDAPVCPGCCGMADLFEGVLDLSKSDRSHPVGLA